MMNLNDNIAPSLIKIKQGSCQGHVGQWSNTHRWRCSCLFVAGSGCLSGLRCVHACALWAVCCVCIMGENTNLSSEEMSLKRGDLYDCPFCKRCVCVLSPFLLLYTLILCFKYVSSALALYTT